MNARSSDIHFIHFIQNIFGRKRICDVTDVRNDIFSCVSIFVAPLNLSLFCCKKDQDADCQNWKKNCRVKKNSKVSRRWKFFCLNKNLTDRANAAFNSFTFSSFSKFAVETKWASPRNIGLGHISLNILLI